MEELRPVIREGLTQQRHGGERDFEGIELKRVFFATGTAFWGGILCLVTFGCTGN
jgi:hypothetical protein